jgi:integration host factor subunit alpha
MALTKAELVDLLLEKLVFTRKEAKQIVEIFFEEIKQVLAQGQSVKLSGFGSFCLREKSARPGRNPKTGQVCVIHARHAVTFRTSEIFKKSVEAMSYRK